MAKILEIMKYGEQIWLLNRAFAILTEKLLSNLQENG